MEKSPVKQRQLPDNVTLSVSEDAASLAQSCFEWLVSAVKETKADRVFLPAGNTPIALYQIMELRKDPVFEGVTFVQVDDVVTGSQRGVFKRFFEKHLPSYCHQFEFIDASEDASLSKPASDIAVLGVGLNGHVAFHEPGVDHSFSYGSVDLSEQTIKNLRLEPSARGVSYGLGHFMKVKKVLMIARGEDKALVSAEVLQGKKSLPASAFLSHPDFTFAGDRGALEIFLNSADCPGVAVSDFFCDRADEKITA